MTLLADRISHDVRLTEFSPPERQRDIILGVYRRVLRNRPDWCSSANQLRGCWSFELPRRCDLPTETSPAVSRGLQRHGLLEERYVRKYSETVLLNKHLDFIRSRVYYAFYASSRRATYLFFSTSRRIRQNVTCALFRFLINVKFLSVFSSRHPLGEATYLPHVYASACRCHVKFSNIHSRVALLVARSSEREIPRTKLTEITRL